MCVSVCVCVCVCVRAGEGRGATITDRLVMSVGHLSEKDMGLEPRRLVLARDRERELKINTEKETDREIEG